MKPTTPSISIIIDIEIKGAIHVGHQAADMLKLPTPLTHNVYPCNDYIIAPPPSSLVIQKCIQELQICGSNSIFGV